VPPNVGRHLAAFAFFGGDQTRGHVWLALDGVRVENVVLGVFDINEDGVVFGWPAILGLAAVVVSPDDFVQKAVAAKQRIEQNLGIVRLSIVEVQI